MSDTTESIVRSQVHYSGWTRVSQLIIGIICMAMIANLQYGWTLFVNPIVGTYHFDKKALQYAFTIFVLFETWLVPFKGYAVDKIGPRFLIVIGGLLVGASWVLNAYASSLGNVLPGRCHRPSGGRPPSMEPVSAML